MSALEKNLFLSGNQETAPEHYDAATQSLIYEVDRPMNWEQVKRYGEYMDSLREKYGQKR